MYNFILPVSLVLGLAALYYGANWLVSGSCFVARFLGVRLLVVGLTVVAFGTSAPELGVSVGAALAGSPQIALGNIVGSVMANAGLVLGVSALVKPLRVEVQLFKREVPALIISMLLFFVLSLDLKFTRTDGWILLAWFVVFVWYSLKGMFSLPEEEKLLLEREYQKHVQMGGRVVSNVIFIAIGLAALFAGARLVVFSVVGVAQLLKIPTFVIAVSIVAVGTSLPELATSIVAAFRGQHDISIGNVIGSNVFNVTLCIGLAALFAPFSVQHYIITRDSLAMIAVNVLLAYFMITHRVITRLEGAMLVLAYVAYLVLTFGGWQL